MYHNLNVFIKFLNENHQGALEKKRNPEGLFVVHFFFEVIFAVKGFITCWKYSCMSLSAQGSDTPIGLTSFDTSQALISMSFNDVKSFGQVGSKFDALSLNSSRIAPCLLISVAKMSKVSSYKLDIKY